jgi:hypothetical protein
MKLAIVAALVLVPLGACSGGSSTTTKGDAKPAAKTDAEPAAKGGAKADAKADAKPVAKSDAKADAKVEESSDAWSFDDQEVGKVPAFVRPAQAGAPSDPATWAVVADPEAPSPPNAFGVTKAVGEYKAFNIALFPKTSIKDVDITVSLKATSGENNRGGGVIFRAKSEKDHYVARWNPVEKNVRIYSLVGDARVDIASADLDIDAAKWHTLRVVAQGDEIEVFVDDQPVVRATDKTFQEAGMIGLWTKGDAATLFDDLAMSSP